MYGIVLLTEKKKLKAQQILKALFRNATSAWFQNKKLKHNTTYAIAEVALCDSNCALPTSDKLQYNNHSGSTLKFFN